jgi:ADP-ribose pyrophosphatase YjhB (NUDIX family)
MVDVEIKFHQDNAQFVYCVRGISIYRDRLLLFTAEGIGMDCWALPGGRVEMKEKSEDALRREMQEELGTDVKVGRLVWVMENFFKASMSELPGEARERFYHEIGMYYLMTLPSNAGILKSEEYSSMDGRARLIFRWVPLSELDNIDLRPTFLRKALNNMPQHTEHIVWKDN